MNALLALRILLQMLATSFAESIDPMDSPFFIETVAMHWFTGIRISSHLYSERRVSGF